MLQRTLPLLAFAALASCASAQYTLQFLPNATIPGYPVAGDSLIGELTNGGLIAGTSGNYSADETDFRTRATLWSGGSATNLGTLPGADNSQGNGLNDLGVIVGYSDVNAAKWSGGSVVNLGRLAGGSYSVANDINDAGITVGYGDNASGEQRAIIWSPTNTRSVLSISGADYSAANAISEAGHIAGEWAADGGINRLAFSALNGVVTNYGQVITGLDTYAKDVNSNGVITGTGLVDEDTGETVAFVSSGTSLISLALADGFTSASGESINDSGQIVGNMSNSEGEQSAFLWSNGVTVNLNEFAAADLDGWTLLTASAINNSGQISGLAFKDDVYSSYLLTPVPEPATMTVLALAALIKRRRAAKKN